MTERRGADPEVEVPRTVPPALRPVFRRAVQAQRESRLEEALEAWREIRRSELFPEAAEPFRIGVLTHLGTCLAERYRATSDVDDLRRAVELWTETAARTEALGRSAAGHYSNLGSGYGMLFERRGRRRDLERAVAYLRRAVQEVAADDPARVPFQENLARVLRLAFEELGEPVLDEAVEVARRVAAASGGEDGPGAGELGLALLARFQRDGALADLEAAIGRLRASLRSTGEAGAARYRMNLGVALSLRYHALGDLEDLRLALRLFEQALRATPPGSSRRADGLHDYALNLHALYQHTRDPRHLDGAIGAWREVVGQGEPRGRHLGALGAALAERAGTDGAAEDLDRAIELLARATEDLTGGDGGGVEARLNLASALRERSRRTGQRDDLEAALELLRSLGGTAPHPAVPMGLADAQRQLVQRWGGDAGLRQQAVRHYRAAVEAATKVSPQIALEAAHRWADWEFHEGRWEAAVEGYRAAFQALDRLTTTQIARGFQEMWLSRFSGLTSRAAFAALVAGEAAVAVDLLEAGTSRLLAETLQRDGLVLAAPGTVPPELQESMRREAARLARLAAPGGLPYAGPPTLEAAEEVRSARRRLEAVRGEIVDALERSGAGGPELALLRRPTAAELAAVLEPDEALVYLWTTPAGTAALTLARRVREGGEGAPELERFRFEGLTAEVLEEHLVERDGDRAVRGGYVAGQVEGREVMRPELDRLLPWLGDVLMAPLARWVRRTGRRRLVLVPIGHLDLLPLEAALEAALGAAFAAASEAATGGAPGAPAAPALSRAPSGQVFRLARSALAGRGIASPHLVGVGNPLPSSPPLPCASLELDQVARLFPRHAVRHGTAATRAFLLSHLARASHLHLACHATFAPGPPLEMSIHLAGEERLELDELRRLAPLHAARLIVLSACQTAIRETHRLPDESIGLFAAFLQAGVPGVVGTLWPVPERATALFMWAFYRRYLGPDGCERTSPAVAVAHARRWLREVTWGELAAVARDWTATTPPPRRSLAEELAAWFGVHDPVRRPYSHPYHWAAFVHHGA